jgi:hypothetical protein
LAKSTVIGIWITGLVLVMAGVVAGLIGGLLGVGSTSSNDVQGFFSALANTTGGVILIGGFILILIGGLIQVIAWILGLVATAMIGQWTWFVVLLVLGLIGLEFFVMLAYAIWGPSERRQVQALASA